MVGGTLVGAALLAAAPAVARPGASLIVFPKVAADGDRDTLIQIVNVSESSARLRCFYSDAVSAALEFRLELGALQPTMWSARQGRAVDPSDPRCSDGNLSCVGAGNDPGEIPPLVERFAGALWCVQTDATGSPAGGDALAGQATLQERGSGDVIRYPAVGLADAGQNDGDDTLCLGGGVRPDCPAGAEYESCPDTWILPHLSDGTVEPATRDGTVSVELTTVLCSLDLTAPASSARLTFALTNELEESFSAATTVPGWSSFPLRAAGNVFRREVAGSDQVLARIRPAGAAAGGVLLLAEALRDNGDGTTRTALQLLHQDPPGAGDVLRIGAAGR